MSTQRYQPAAKEGERAQLARILELVAEFPRCGYRQITRLLQSEGWHVKAKRVYRLWRQEGLKVPKRTVKRRRLNVDRFLETLFEGVDVRRFQELEIPLKVVTADF